MEDEAQIKLLRHQARSDRFDLEFSDYSVKEPFDSNWKKHCEERIKRSSVIVCAIGKDTYKRAAVLWEINKAYELGKPVIGMRIHKDHRDLVPGPMRRNNAKVINWNLKELQKAIDRSKNGRKRRTEKDDAGNSGRD